MWFVLIWPVTLSLVVTGQSCTKEILRSQPETCCKQCPAGYHRMKTCDGTENTYKCEICVNGSTYTDVSNHLDRCLLCKNCHDGEMVNKGCVIDSDTVCACKHGYYQRRNNERDKSLHCISCPDAPQSCHVEECRRNCPAATTAMNTPVPTATNTTERPTDPIITSIISKDYIHVMIAVVFSTLLLATVGLCLYLCRNGGCRHRGKRGKDVQMAAMQPRIREQDRYLDGSGALMMLNVCEGIPAPSLHSPVNPGPCDRVTPLLPSQGHGAVRREASWPAGILYSIIAEVPLRRWREFLRLLGVGERQLERAELEGGVAALGSRETQYQALLLWSRRPSAALRDVYAALRIMELEGCGQRLRERLEGVTVAEHAAGSVAESAGCGDTAAAAATTALSLSASSQPVKIYHATS